MLQRWVFAATLAAGAAIHVPLLLAQGRPPQPNSWTPARTAFGQPDLQGAWAAAAQLCNLETGICHQDGQAIQGRTQTHKPVSVIVDPPDGKIPYQQWAAEKRDAMEERRNAPTGLRDIAPISLCLLGAPRAGGFRITQTRDFVILSWERTHGYRVIALNGGSHPGADVHLAVGDGRGHWEGNTLVIETANISDWTWFDAAGSFHSDAIRTTERLTLLDTDTLEYRAVVTDPKVLTRPFTMVVPQRRARLRSDDELAGEFVEDSCVEGNARNLEKMLRTAPPRP